MIKHFVWREGQTPMNVFFSWGHATFGWGFYIYFFGLRLTWFNKK